MVGALTWCVVVLVAGVLVAASLVVSEMALARDTSISRSRRGLVVALGAAAALIAVALLWRVMGLAQLDGHVLSALSRSRGATLDQVMAVLTTTGDVVPSFCIAAILSLLICLQGRHRYAAWVLPLVVLSEVVIQFAFAHVFHDIEIGRVQPGLPLGGFGTIPSGSVSRLFSVFLVASWLWAGIDVRGARRLMAVGNAILLIEIVTRLYLGRHLLADIVSGLALGLVLANGLSWLLRTWCNVDLRPTRDDTGGRSTSAADGGSVSLTNGRRPQVLRRRPRR